MRDTDRVSYQHLLVSTDGPITTITLNRPEKRNALAYDVLAELLDASDAPPFAPGAWASWALAIALTVTLASCHQEMHMAQVGAPSNTSLSGPTANRSSPSPVTGPSRISRGSGVQPLSETGIMIVGTSKVPRRAASR